QRASACMLWANKNNSGFADALSVLHEMASCKKGHRCDGRVPLNAHHLLGSHRTLWIRFRQPIPRFTSSTVNFGLARQMAYGSPGSARLLSRIRVIQLMDATSSSHS